MTTADRPLTGRQAKFAELVASGKCAQVEAYREAYPASKKWKPEIAVQAASRLVSHSNVSTTIERLRRAAAAAAKLDATEVLAEVRKLAHSDIGNLMHADGRVKLPHELDAATRAAVKKFKIDELGRIEYEFWDKGAALDKAMKNLGLYEKDNSQKPAVKIDRIELVPLADSKDEPKAVE
jgi:phage terminase small subunit